VARRPTLSPSKITCYLACPQQYYWTYVNPRGKWYLRTRSTYSFGLSLHRVLERFYDEREQGVTTTHQALAALEENWIEAGYSSAEEMQEALGEGKAILSQYLEEIEMRPVEGKTLHVEYRLKHPMGEWDLIGRADRIVEREDGAIDVFDYKSGRRDVSPEEVATDIAMCAYAAMLRPQYLDRPIQATLIPLRGGEPATHRFTGEELDEFLFACRELGDRILNHEWAEVEPLPKALCPHCDFIKLCARDPRYAEMAAGQNLER
jgi:RecB family exonuclease